MPKQLQPSDSLTSIEKGVKNKFKWEWMMETDPKGTTLGDYIRKIDVAGLCICLWCNMKQINYGSSGKKVLKQHALCQQHKDAADYAKAAENAVIDN